MTFTFCSLINVKLFFREKVYSRLVDHLFALPGEAKMPPSKLALMLAFAAFIAFPTEAAEARHRHHSGACPSGMIKRLSLGVCVSKRSRAARGFVVRAHLRRTSGRHLFHRYIARHQPEAAPPPEAEAPVEKYQDRIERSQKTDKASSSVSATELQWGIPGSLLMRPPAATRFHWELCVGRDLC